MDNLPQDLVEMLHHMTSFTSSRQPQSNSNACFEYTTDSQCANNINFSEIGSELALILILSLVATIVCCFGCKFFWQKKDGPPRPPNTKAVTIPENNPGSD
jgi:hypothetical protein